MSWFVKKMNQKTNEESYNKNITDVSKKDIFLVPFLLLNFTKSSICLKYILGKSIFVLFSYRITQCLHKLEEKPKGHFRQKPLKICQSL